MESLKAFFWSRMISFENWVFPMAVSLQISTGEAREGKLSELITFQARNTILSSTLLIRYRLKVSVINRACFSFKYS